MKAAASVKKMCRNCKIIRRNGVVRVICTDPRHKQRQGWGWTWTSHGWLVLACRGPLRLQAQRL